MMQVIIGEVAMGDLIINTEGLGMFDGTGVTPPEVQTSFMFAVGPFIQHDWWGMGNLPLNASQLQHYINTSHPVLWLDHWGYPVNQSLLMPGSGERPIQGHAKVIGGFDDSNTAGVRSDDLVLIYDPWPEYTDLGILPVNASKGPGGTFDPYWLPLNDVNLSNISDIFLVDMFPDQPAVPEFTVLIIPILGVMAIALTASRWRSRNRET